ncbi:hypothetical protein FPSE5266_20133 [Fusarium pseudograminearum]|nr:hypothetical protein FPSE5266_20133 [Fusarium pseudograminearum]
MFADVGYIGRHGPVPAESSFSLGSSIASELNWNYIADGAVTQDLLMNDLRRTPTAVSLSAHQLPVHHRLKEPLAKYPNTKASLPSIKMCTLKYVTYTCGCQKDAEFVQCEARQGTNVRCHRLARESLKNATNHCQNHLVKPDARTQYTDQNERIQEE